MFEVNCSTVFAREQYATEAISCLGCYGLRLPFKSFKRFKALQGCGPTVRLTMEGGGRAFKV